MSNNEAKGPAVPSTALSPIEKSCLRMIAEGRTPNEIAALMVLSVTQVEHLLSAAEEKLGARNRLHAVSIAMLTGEIELDGLHGRNPRATG